jgi:hypothetical protein
MPSSKSFKFHGSSIQLLTGFSSDSPSHAITAITQANPAVVTSATHGLSDGDVIKIDGVAGMVEVNDEAFIVEVVDANSFQLVDTDSTGYGAYVSAGGFDVGEFSNMCELTNYNRQGGTSAEIPTTSLCSVAQEYEIDLPDFGTTQIDFKFAPRTAIQEALEVFYRPPQDKMALKITLPNSGGEMVQLGFVQQKSEQAGTGTIWTASATIRNTGPRYDVEA